jgi:hypothetical protein
LILILSFSGNFGYRGLLIDKASVPGDFVDLNVLLSLLLLLTPLWPRLFRPQLLSWSLAVSGVSAAAVVLTAIEVSAVARVSALAAVLLLTSHLLLVFPNGLGP